MYTESLIQQCNEIPPMVACKGGKYAELRYELASQTSFLNPISPSIRTRYYCVLNRVTELPKCKKITCSNAVYANKKDNKLGFNEYCSLGCSRSDKTVDLEIENKLSDKEWMYEQRIVLKKSKDLIAEELGCSVVPVNK